jgi:ribosomal protein S18 acetylase RimI-like enzyme
MIKSTFFLFLSMSEIIVIRKATAKDASAIVNAEKKIAQKPGYFVSLPGELNEQNVIKTIETLKTTQEGIYLAAEINGKIVGHAFLAPLHLKSICHVVSLTIGVHEGWQEKGVGTALMQKLIEWAKNSDQIEKIELNVRASNTRAIALYKKMGFVEEGRLKNRIKIASDHYIDDILMALDVKQGADD